VLKIFELSKHKKNIKIFKEYLTLECEHLYVSQIKQSGAENLKT